MRDLISSLFFTLTISSLALGAEPKTMAEDWSQALLDKLVLNYTTGKQWIFRGQLTIHELASNSDTTGAVVGKRERDGDGLHVVNRARKTPQGHALGILVSIYESKEAPAKISYSFPEGMVVWGSVEASSPLIEQLSFHVSGNFGNQTIDGIRFHDLPAKAIIAGSPAYGSASGELRALMPWNITYQDLLDAEAVGKDGKDLGDTVVLAAGPTTLQTRHWRELAQPDVCPESRPIRECRENFAFRTELTVPKLNLARSRAAVTEIGPLKVVCQCKHGG
jgi:hypothetical protein